MSVCTTTAVTRSGGPAAASPNASVAAVSAPAPAATPIIGTRRPRTTSAAPSGAALRVRSVLSRPVRISHRCAGLCDGTPRGRTAPGGAPPDGQGGVAPATDGSSGLPERPADWDSRCGTGTSGRPRDRGDRCHEAPTRLLLLLAAAAVGLTACGQSSQDKAKSQVCDARADISKQVNELKGLTLSTATVDGVKKNVQAIQDDLGKIKDAQGNLNADRKKQVQAANEAFTQQVKSIASSVRQEPVAVERRTQLQTAVSQLAAQLPADARESGCS